MQYWKKNPATVINNYLGELQVARIKKIKNIIEKSAKKSFLNTFLVVRQSARSSKKMQNKNGENFFT